jgi:hypothetical protein
LQLGFAALVLLAATAARAEVASLDLRTGVYQDSDRTFVSTTTVAARGTIKDRVTIEARYLIDAITSASVDVVTAATSAFHENRHEAAAQIAYHDGTRSASAGYVYSVENDWESHTANAGLSHDLAQHNVTLGLGGTFVHNAVGRSGDPTFHRTLLVAGGSAFLAVTASPRDQLGLSYTVAWHDGYQASPYRFVFFEDASGARGSAPEADPQTRLRHAITARLHHHVGRDSALQAHLRGYLDDWGVYSGTAGLEYLIGFGELTLGLHVRGYAQEHASFYQAVYAQPLAFMTADRELSRFVDGFGGARLTWRRAHAGPFGELRAEVKVDGFGFWFFDFPRLQSRDGIVAELALGATL